MKSNIDIDPHIDIATSQRPNRRADGRISEAGPRSQLVAVVVLARARHAPLAEARHELLLAASLYLVRAERVLEFVVAEIEIAAVELELAREAR